MSWFDALYGGPGRGIGPHEPEKKGLHRFFQMVGRDFGQLLATNVLVCVLVLPAALGVSLGVILLQFPLTVAAGLLGGLLAGPALLMMADCSLRSLCNDPSAWTARALRTLSAKWKTALPLGAVLIALLGALSFVWSFFVEAMESGLNPGGAVLVFLLFDLLVLAVVGSLMTAALAAAPAGGCSLGRLLHTALRLLLASPGRAVAGGAVVFAGAAVLIRFFPLSTFWAILFGFWLPVLAAMQIFFPMLRETCGLTAEYRAPAFAGEPERPLTERQQKARSRANWWYYNWGLVMLAAVLVIAVVYVVHGLTTTVDPDYNVALVTTDTLPDASVLRLQQMLERYGEDRNKDGVVVVSLNVYTWSADADQNDMSSQMAGATRMNTDLANGDSGIWILADPAGFESAYGALSETLGSGWAGQLVRWNDVPALAEADLGSYNTSADGSTSQSVQQLLADYQIAVLDDSDGLWARLTGSVQVPAN